MVYLINPNSIYRSILLVLRIFVDRVFFRYLEDTYDDLMTAVVP